MQLLASNMRHVDWRRMPAQPRILPVVVDIPDIWVFRQAPYPCCELQKPTSVERPKDAAYEKAVSCAENRAFKVLAVAFIVLFAFSVLSVAWLGY